jgi:hypothetical protein
MKDQLPSPDFNRGQYERPNLKWECGQTASGKRCRLGPGSKGECRAGFECKPAFEAATGETKGRFRCTRSAEQGGPCEIGPQPDGSCSRKIPKCQPVRSLRSKRAVLVKAFSALIIGALALVLSVQYCWSFISPGPISRSHNSVRFAEMTAKAHPGNTENCAACHVAARGGILQWVQASMQAKPSPFRIDEMIRGGHPGMTKLDESCTGCHGGRTFHNVSVRHDYSCSQCHREHESPGRLKRAEAKHCLFCHSDASALRTIHPIQMFEVDHPEFELIRNKVKDSDTLHFSHQTHQSGNSNIPKVNGQSLDCGFCHKPENTGIYYKPPSFETSCKPCHALQFDKRNPDLAMPHGNVEAVKAFLRSAPAQYADYARRKKGLQGAREVEVFVAGEVGALKEQYGSGEELERRAFFSSDMAGPTSDSGRLGQKGRPLFPGCAYCHPVQDGKIGPEVTAPIIRTRWLTKGRFDHARHLAFSCTECHKTGTSTTATDVLLPGQQTCARCHNSQGVAGTDCMLCHQYHNAPSLRAKIN